MGAGHGFGLPFVVTLLALPLSSFAQEIIQPDLKTISPVFDGWLRNSDGTITLFFGYFNRNLNETPIAVGSNNGVAQEPEDRGTADELPAATPATCVSDHRSGKLER